MDVIILRGIPGSGKSTYAKSISCPWIVICSADDFLSMGGSYNFNPSQLRNAHDWCYGKYRASLALDVPLVVVDNTNTRAWEFERYISAAKEWQYNVRVCRMVADVETCIRRQVHNVPADKILQMAERFEDYPGEELIITKG